jgi:hypothetical protein
MPKGDTTSRVTSTDNNKKPALCCDVTLSHS